MTFLKKKKIRLTYFLAAGLLFVGSGFLGAEELPPSRYSNDPFKMRSGQLNKGGLVAASSAAFPSGIRVLGILAVKGSDPVGVLQIPGMRDTFFVKSGDVIQVDISEHGEWLAADKHSSAYRQVYLLVKSVTADEIVLAPRTRPQDYRVYR